MYNFADISVHSCIDEAVNDIFIRDYIAKKAKAIIRGKEKDYPSAKEMMTWPDHIWKPKDDLELHKFIRAIKEPLLECNLNWIDTSSITLMNSLFWNNNRRFNGDISRWDVSNVTNMEAMFAYSNFKGDISNWNVSKVVNMRWMFEYSEFHGDLSSWVLKGYMTKKRADRFNLLKYMKYV